MSVFSITDANRVGISGLVSSAEPGWVVTLSRHGKPVAEIVSREEMDLLRRDRETLRDVVLVMTRMVTDSGNRTELDDAMEAFGINRDELESEIRSGPHTLPWRRTRSACASPTTSTGRTGRGPGSCATRDNHAGSRLCSTQSRKPPLRAENPGCVLHNRVEPGYTGPTGAGSTIDHEVDLRFPS